MVNWVLVKVLGQRSCGKVFLPNSTMEPLDYFAIKVARLYNSSSLLWEKNILKHFIGCPEIVQCLGSEITIDENYLLYNLKLEYATSGTLANLIEQRKKLLEDEVKEYLKMILRGLSCIHRNRFVHVDLEPDNILAFPHNNGKMKLKIADFRLSRRCDEKDEVDEDNIYQHLCENLDGQTKRKQST
ncbi:calcium-dependent protein kinase 4-like [Benincasa hispida]|uniref:calcium-dependent protein kinase 4-like n=1 Tax=Benincasa hispida TaxID=102211 RepID=UPI0019012DC4|nr:calcium-dependent protein kinase 4-like [Benincasa hispida]